MIVIGDIRVSSIPDCAAQDYPENTKIVSFLFKEEYAPDEKGVMIAFSFIPNETDAHTFLSHIITNFQKVKASIRNGPD